MANLGTLAAKLELDGALPPQRIDADALAAAVPRVQSKDVRDGNTLQRELTRMDYQIRANRDDADDAEKEVVSTTGRLVQLTKVRKQVEAIKNHGEKQPRLERVDKEIEDVRFILAQQKNKLDVSTRIAHNREQVRKDFLALRPFEGARSNEEVINEAVELEKIDRTIAQTV